MKDKICRFDPPEKKHQKRFEYKIKLISSNSLDSLNSMGNEGWELVSIIVDSWSRLKAYFKREMI